MIDDEETPFTSEWEEETFVFCSAECKQTFDANPRQYVVEKVEQDLGS
jgi:YHS domain-containing protein